MGGVSSFDFANDLGVDLEELVKVDGATVIAVSGVKMNSAVAFDQGAGHLAEENPLCVGRKRKRSEKKKKGEERKKKDKTDGVVR